MNKPTLSEYIEIVAPRAMDYVGASFVVEGWVNLAWFDNSGHGLRWDMFYDYLGNDARNFAGGSVAPILDDRVMKDGMVSFTFKCFLSSANIGFLESSHGRFTLKIGSCNEKIFPVYIPVIVKQFEDTDTYLPQVIEAHLGVGEKEAGFIRDLEIYNQQMALLDERRRIKDGGVAYDYIDGPSISLALDILKIIDESSDSFDDYTYSEEDERENELNEIYKDALEWRGPLARGLVSSFGGFDFRVYSDDHDQHFHVIHRGKRIDARFSFPDFRLISYKTKKQTISSRLEKKIREHCLRPDIFKKFEYEFQKRS